MAPVVLFHMFLAQSLALNHGRIGKVARMNHCPVGQNLFRIGFRNTLEHAVNVNKSISSHAFLIVVTPPCESDVWDNAVFANR